VKVTIAFDVDPKRIGKTVEVDDAEAHQLITEGRARPAKDGEVPVAFQGPTRRPPMPDVVLPDAMVPTVGPTQDGAAKKGVKAGKAPTDGAGSAAS
jgi:hypothetical protein